MVVWFPGYRVPNVCLTNTREGLRVISYADGTEAFIEIKGRISFRPSSCPLLLSVQHDSMNPTI